MSKFKLSLPIKTADLRESLLHLHQEMNLLKGCFRKAGVSVAQGQLLLEVDRAEPISVVGLTHLLGLDKSTISQGLSQLQRLGFVNLVENPSDRRFKNITLTVSGHTKITDIQKSFDDELEGLFTACSEGEKNAIALGVGIFSQILSEKRELLAEKNRNKNTGNYRADHADLGD